MSVITAAAVTLAQPAAGLPGLQTGAPPWGRGTDGLRERLHAIGVPALAEEGTVLHTHQHLDIFVLGRHVTVPGGIGIDADERFIAPIHTHDPSGILHVESDEVRAFTLGQFFDIWGVRLSDRCIGGECVDDVHTLTAFVDGREVAGDPRAVELKPHQEIALVYARKGSAAVRVPSSYTFPPGL